MDLLVRLCFILFLLLGSGCAKVGYVVEQGWGQLGLQWKGVKNAKLLADPEVPTEIKEKIEQIEQARAHFFEFWQAPPTSIYRKTTLLDRQAVSYLVISSPYDRITPHRECFWFVGCFPYLGFFNEKSARKYQARMEARDFVTIRRPVYAYSSLGRFEDRILSSFFHFSDFDLIELVFHELYHTLFFVKDEVDLNENLANFIGREMAYSYFEMSPEERLNRQRSDERQGALRRHMVMLTGELNERYKSLGELSREQAELTLQSFLEETFYPQMSKLCEELELSRKDCFPLHRRWNNASLAAYLTYESRGSEIEALYERFGRNLRELQLYIEQKYEEYQKLKKRERPSFESFLLNPGTA
jgi:predicted aminopeptidase